MPRTKVKLEYIADDNSRKTSFIKRKASVKKKLSELCTLCGVDACAIMYSQYDEEADVWPSNIVAQYVLDQFMLVPEVEQSKKMVNQDSYIRKRICKAQEKFDKQNKENREKMVGIWISECVSGERSLANLSKADLKEMVSLIDHQVSEIDARLELLKAGGTPPPPPPPPTPSVPQPQTQLALPQADVGGSITDNHMVEGGVAANGYVPVAENLGALEGIIPSSEWLANYWPVDDMDFDSDSDSSCSSSCSETS